MSSILVINAAGAENRVALVENGTITEFYLERKKDKGIVGNIYKGRVVRVLPGMQAAFVDIGLEKAAFLYVSDVFYVEVINMNSRKPTATRARTPSTLDTITSGS